MIVLYKGEDCIVAAKIALAHRLYVSGWSLSGDLVNIRKGKSHHNYRMAIAYNDEMKPIGVATHSISGSIQCFVKASERRKGVGRKLVQNFKNSYSHGGWGVQGSELFWGKCGVRVD